MEIEIRPRPQDLRSQTHKPKLAGLLLAAGTSSRMGGSNKLLSLFDGVSLLARSACVLEQALSRKPVVVLGHDAARMAKLLPEGATVVVNPDFAEGLSTSLRSGVAALGSDYDGVLIHLADMPTVTAQHLKLLSDAFDASGGCAVIRATHDGKSGNPVVLPRALFSQLIRLTGDTGARILIEGFTGKVVDVELGAAARLDVDTPEALKAAGGIMTDPDMD
jgi:molybdenum cofactor cytidylyltransferase